MQAFLGELVFHLSPQEGGMKNENEKRMDGWKTVHGPLLFYHAL